MIGEILLAARQENYEQLNGESLLAAGQENYEQLNGKVYLQQDRRTISN